MNPYLATALKERQEAAKSAKKTPAAKSVEKAAESASKSDTQHATKEK